MDFFTSVRKNFEQQASKARVFAQNVSGKAQDLAQVAKANALVLAEKLKEEARDLTEQSHWQEAAEKAKQKFLSLTQPKSNDGVSSEHQLETYGITDTYKEFIRSLDYSTFRDFNEQDIQSSVGFFEDGDGLRLNPWQEQHAILALKASHELDHLRYLLCPKRMTEEKFWLVYFALAQSHLPEGCRTGELPDLQHSPTPVTPTVQQASDNEEKQEDEEDELDKYLKDVLEDDAEGTSSQDDEGFEDLDDYMEQLNAEMDSQKEASVASDAIESLDDSPNEQEEKLPGTQGEGFLVNPPEEGKENEDGSSSEAIK